MSRLGARWWRLLVVLAISAVAAWQLEWPRGEDPAASGTETVRTAFAQQRSGFMVETAGVVQRTLADDNKGSRHQRFIVELEPELTVLVAHNIDLAPRVPLAVGDAVEFKGQYEWNDRGGVVHWTHHDPDGGDHEEGWIRHRGKLYR